MLPEEIYDATKEFNPVLFTESCKEYPTIKEGDAVLDYGTDLALIYENGNYQVCYSDWIGNFKNPLPILQLILRGNVREIYPDEESCFSELVIKGEWN